MTDKEKFNILSNDWKTRTGHLSNVSTICSVDSYREIVKMGEVAVPFIIEDLINNGPSHWFVALTEITKENPITQDIAGNMMAMRDAWINKYLKGEA